MTGGPQQEERSCSIEEIYPHAKKTDMQKLEEKRSFDANMAAIATYSGVPYTLQHRQEDIRRGHIILSVHLFVRIEV